MTQKFYIPMSLVGGAGASQKISGFLSVTEDEMIKNRQKHSTTKVAKNNLILFGFTNALTMLNSKELFLSVF